MVWFRIDDGWHSHPKVLELSLAAAGLWAKAGSWCADHLTDGRITPAAVRSLGGTAKLAAELVASGLWLVVDGGWQFHQWSERQPTRASVEQERLQKSQRQRRWRSGDASRDSNVDASTDTSRDSGVEPAPARAFSRPVPSRPDQDGESAPDGAESEPQTPTSKSLLRRGYAQRYEDPSHAGVMWQGHAFADRDIGTVAAWADAQAKRDGLTAGQVVACTLDEFFADDFERKHEWDWLRLAKNPGKFYRRHRGIQSRLAERGAA